MNFIKVAASRLALVMVFLSTGIAGLAQDPDQVGDRGNPDHLVFEGNHYFTDAEMRYGLMEHREFILASHPLAPWADYLPQLEAIIKSGYEFDGFPETEVHASSDKDGNRIAVKITEGPHYTIDEIHVSGAKRISVSALLSKLKEKPDIFHHKGELISERIASGGGSIPATVTATWTKGYFASLGKVADQYAEEKINAVIQQLGFIDAKIKVAQVLNPKKHTVDLQVDILQEGFAGKVDDITITGLKRNRREDVLKCLDVKKGAKFTRVLQEKLESRLWESGRFVSFDITPEDESGSEGRLLKLNIELREDDKVPPLNERLSRGAQGLLKAADWLNGPESFAEDILLDFTEPEKWGGGYLRFVYSQHGLLMTETPAGNAPLRYAGLFSEKTFGLFDVQNHLKLAAPAIFSNAVVSSYAVLLPDKKPDPDHPYGLTFGGGFNFRDGEKTQFIPDRLFTPAAFVHLAYTSGCKLSFSGGDIVATNDEGVLLRIDEKTGRLLELAMPAAIFPKAEVSFRHAAFQKAEKEINRVGAGAPDALDTKHPLDSALCFLIQRAAQMGNPANKSKPAPPAGQADRVVGALNALLAEHPFVPLDEMLALRGVYSSGDGFSFPSEPHENLTTIVLRRIMLRDLYDLFPQNSWPRTLVRESVLVTEGEGKYSSSALNEMANSGEGGPLFYLTSAFLLKQINPVSAKEVAVQGLLHLQKDDFQKDWALALRRDCVLQRICENLARSLARLDEQQVAALGEIMGPKEGAFLKQAAKALRERGDKSVADALAPVLDDYWDNRLQGLVRENLKKLIASGPVASSQ